MQPNLSAVSPLAVMSKLSIMSSEASSAKLIVKASVFVFLLRRSGKDLICVLSVFRLGAYVKNTAHCGRNG